MDKNVEHGLVPRNGSCLLQWSSWLQLHQRSYVVGSLHLVLRKGCCCWWLMEGMIYRPSKSSTRWCRLLIRWRSQPFFSIPPIALFLAERRHFLPSESDSNIIALVLSNCVQTSRWLVRYPKFIPFVQL